MFCSKCGKEINDEAVICVHCGCSVNSNIQPEGHDWLVTMLLSWFLGGFGAHRFYTGHIGTAIAQLLTLGGCGIWAFIDWVCICFNSFKDFDGKSLNNYKKTVGITLFSIGMSIFVLLILLRVIIFAATNE